MSITATSTAVAIRIGSVRLTSDVKTEDTYATASWYRNFTSAAGQVIDLVATLNPKRDYWNPGTYMVKAVASGVCTGSNFQSSFGGMAFGSGQRDLEVGSVEDRTVLSVTDFYIADLMAGLIEGREGIEIELDEEAFTSLGLGDIEEAKVIAIHRDRDLKIRMAQSAHRDYLEACAKLYQAGDDDRKVKNARKGVEIALRSRDQRHHNLIERYPADAWRTDARI